MRVRRKINKVLYEGIVGRIEQFRNDYFLCVYMKTSYEDNKIIFNTWLDEPWHERICVCNPFMLSIGVRELLTIAFEHLGDKVYIDFKQTLIEDKRCNFEISFFDISAEENKNEY